MLTIDLLGYVAGMFLLMMASMKTQLAMRVCNMAGNVCFVMYGYMADVMPVFILNIVILCLHLWRILQGYRNRESEPNGQNESHGHQAIPVANTQPPHRVVYKGNLYQRIAQPNT